MKKRRHSGRRRGARVDIGHGASFGEQFCQLSDAGAPAIKLTPFPAELAGQFPD